MMTFKNILESLFFLEKAQYLSIKMPNNKNSKYATYTCN